MPNRVIATGRKAKNDKPSFKGSARILRELKREEAEARHKENFPDDLSGPWNGCGASPKRGGDRVRINGKRPAFDAGQYRLDVAGNRLVPLP